MKLSLVCIITFFIVNMVSLVTGEKLIQCIDENKRKIMIVLAACSNVFGMYYIVYVFRNLGYTTINNVIEMLVMISTTIAFANIYLKFKKIYITRVFSFVMYNIINVVFTGMYSIWLLMLANDRIVFPDGAIKYKMYIYMIIGCSYIIINVMFGLLFGKVSYALSEDIMSICSLLKREVLKKNIYYNIINKKLDIKHKEDYK